MTFDFLSLATFWRSNNSTSFCSFSFCRSYTEHTRVIS